MDSRLMSEESNHFQIYDNSDEDRLPFGIISNNGLNSNNHKIEVPNFKKKIDNYTKQQITIQETDQEQEKNDKAKISTLQTVNQYQYEDYISTQQEWHEDMRSLVVDWLIQLTDHYNMVPSTLYLAVQIMDNIFSKSNQCPIEKIQLVGITSLFIASKIEEIYPPNVDQLSQVCDYRITKEEIIGMECIFVGFLKFNFTFPTEFHFLGRFLDLSCFFDDAQKSFCHYLSEIGLEQYELLQFNPLMRASAVIFVTLKFFFPNNDVKWEETEVYNECGYTAKELRQPFKLYGLLLFQSEQKRIQMQNGEQISRVIQKFQKEQFHKVANINIKEKIKKLIEGLQNNPYCHPEFTNATYKQNLNQKMWDEN
ncbi:Cyclin-like protein [Pseudocohnilembus persalinus]|uniref:Cyclin-like protein n=1 Tax=Pseudocohnilembus persalinus TaxID=266149 RepID=A0A0V0QRT9_PSEPJ|nr:Cyclin-like protein [Pseudocohnilembus persalinus]|eukprot:KRX05023.1 Cyclin-like protein [Pseudocohnilembus persalinus]